jgi:hypothetical protein
MFVQNKAVKGQSIGVPGGDVAFDENGISELLTEEQYEYLIEVPGYEHVEVEVTEQDADEEGGEPKPPVVAPKRPGGRRR